MRVVPAINDLCTFVERTDLPVMAQTAIAHAQFETIHHVPRAGAGLTRW